MERIARFDKPDDMEAASAVFFARLMSERMGVANSPLRLLRPGARPRYTKEEDAKIRECVKLGLKHKEIGDILRRSPSSIDRRIQRLGLTKKREKSDEQTS